MKWNYIRLGDIEESQYDELYLKLTPKRKKYIDKMKLQEDKKRSLAAEILLYRLLEKEFGIKNVLLCREESGKPYLCDSELYVSISHCDDIAVCAVDTTPLGIDIERIKDINDALIERVCTDEEKQYVSGGDFKKRFFEIWTKKEAYFKKQGTGITNFKSVNVLSLSFFYFELEDYIIAII